MFQRANIYVLNQQNKVIKDFNKMNNSDLELWCANLNKLLEDICDFLSNECQNDKLSAKAKKQAESLLQKSKSELVKIEKLQHKYKSEDAYVDMQKRQDTESIKTDNENNTPLILETCPYTDLPAKMATKEIKYGHLSWKTRFLLHFEKMRNVYAVLHKNWFLLYNSDKDSKPIQTFNMKYYEARCPSLQKNAKVSNDNIFVLTQISGKEKIQMFVAQSPKDVLQWVFKLNGCHKDTSLIPNNDNASSDISDEYDTIVVKRHSQEKDDEEEENIYDSIAQSDELNGSKRNKLSQITPSVIKLPPELPQRKISSTKADIPLPSVPTEETHDSDSECNTYDPVLELRASSDSFSEKTDEDDIYEVLVVNASPENILKEQEEAKPKEKPPKPKNKPQIATRFSALKNDIPLPPLPKFKSTRHSEDFFRKKLSRISSTTTTSSFSDKQDDDDIYEEFVSTGQN